MVHLHRKSTLKGTLLFLSANSGYLTFAKQIKTLNNSMLRAPLPNASLYCQSKLCDNGQVSRSVLTAREEL